MDVLLRTERLVLRQFTPADVNNVVALDADPEVMRYITGGRPTSRDDVENEVLPRFLDLHRRLDRLGFWAAQTLPGPPDTGGRPGQGEFVIARLVPFGFGRQPDPSRGS